MSTRVTKKLPLVQGTRYRITRLDECGVPLYGDNAQVVTKGLVSVALTVVTNDTDAITVTNSNGEICLNIPAKSQFDSVSAEIVLCGLDPDFFNMATGMPVYTDIDGTVVGNIMDSDVDLGSFAYALEVWTGLGGDDTCGEVGDKEYGYLLLKYMQGGRLSDFTIENAAINFGISDSSSKKGGKWGKGPYPVVVNAGDTAGPLLQALTASQPLLAILTKVAPPAAVGEARPVLNPAWATLTGIDADANDGDMAVDFSVTPTLVSSQGIYYDFGDDSFEYVSTGNGDYTHTFLEAGTFTVTATANGQDVVSVEVTVPFDAS